VLRAGSGSTKNGLDKRSFLHNTEGRLDLNIVTDSDMKSEPASLCIASYGTPLGHAVLLLLHTGLLDGDDRVSDAGWRRRVNKTPNDVAAGLAGTDINFFCFGSSCSVCLF
jgi:hypothetical protein